MNRIYTVPAQYATIYQAEMLHKLGARIKSRLILVRQNGHMYLYQSKQRPSERYLTIPNALDAALAIEQDAKVYERIRRGFTKHNDGVWFTLTIFREGDPNRYYLKARTVDSLTRVYLRFLLTKINQDVKDAQKAKKQARKLKKDNI